MARTFSLPPYETNAGLVLTVLPTEDGVFWGNGAAGSILLETDGIANGSQTILNLTSGVGIALTDDGVGGITIDSTGALVIGGLVIGGTPTEVLYIDNSGNLYSDQDFFRDSVTNDTFAGKDTNVAFTTAMDIGDSIVLGAEHSAFVTLEKIGFTTAFLGTGDASLFSQSGTAFFGFSDDGVALQTTMYGSPLGWQALIQDTIGGEIGGFSATYGTGVSMSYNDGVVPTRFFLVTPSGLGWGEQALGTFFLPTNSPAVGDVLSAPLAGGFGQLRWAAGGGGGSGTPTEVLYYDVVTGLVTSDSGFIRNTATQVSSINAVSGGTAITQQWSPTIATILFADATSVAGITIQDRGLQIRGYSNEVTLECLVIKQQSGVKLMEQKNNGLFFVNGATPISTIPMFSGGGLDDMTTVPLTSYAAFQTSVTYTITIATSGIPDTFDWDDGGAPVTGVPITLLAITLSNNMQIQFGSTTGHTPGDSWTFTVTYTAGKTIYSNFSTSTLVVSFGDIDSLFNNTVFRLDDANQDIDITFGGILGAHVSAVDDLTTWGYRTGSGATGTYIGNHAGDGNISSANTVLGASAFVGSVFPPYTGNGGVRNVSIGATSGLNNLGDDNVYIGYGTRVITPFNFDSSIAIGRDAWIEGSNEMSIGGLGYGIEKIRVQSGLQMSGIPKPVTLVAVDVYAADDVDGGNFLIKAGNAGGTDNSGGDLTLATGISRGASNAQGYLYMKTALPGASGTGLNTLSTWFRLSADTGAMVWGDIDAVQNNNLMSFDDLNGRFQIAMQGTSEINSGQIIKRDSINDATHNIVISEYMLTGFGLSVDRAWTLPAIGNTGTDANDGQVFVIKNSASSSADIVLGTTGGDTIDGSGTDLVIVPGDSATLVANDVANDWEII